VAKKITDPWLNGAVYKTVPVPLTLQILKGRGLYKITKQYYTKVYFS
jgi:hypothetical protein